MKTATDINSQLCQIMSAVSVLNANNVTIKSVLIAGGRPVIRIVNDAHCKRIFGQADVTHITTNDINGKWQHGTMDFNGCKIIWSEFNALL